MSRMTVFRDKHPLIGPVFWMLSVQYYATQVFVAQQFNGGYSWLYNTISDLGNTVCGPYGSRTVCSPLNTSMNASFLVLGIAMIIGSFFIRGEFRKSWVAGTGFAFMALAGIGTILVGLFPENMVAAMHVLGAGLAFTFGNVALLLFSYSLNLPPVFRWYTRLSGIIALVALGLFVSGTYFGLGIGGMERIVAYPQSIWLIAFGIYMSMNHYRRGRGQAARYTSA